MKRQRNGREYCSLQRGLLSHKCHEAETSKGEKGDWQCVCKCVCVCVCVLKDALMKGTPEYSIFVIGNGCGLFVCANKKYLWNLCSS
jgi:hypothetical protein